ncbi:MAG: tyrosine-type recombinase/integrase [Sulfurimonas sp.]|uniref:tyrosine-type recombinase/integrase n=1 Tax=Sulfurimonas sp. TaxID=2022749 RepID=UPI00262448CD|nr:tyrosine-type recombinase/integrase [Sulfurimonas sp.]MDD2651780.1 tyrosine-type recombinase/integrase [Sulfurimonas sp.]MDD3451668.1 tyrosine-type recombinase/integrase [Sulfurimonas sp.]
MKKLLKTKQKEFLLFLEEIRGYSDFTIKSYDGSLNEAFLHIEAMEEKGHILLNLMPYRIKIASLNPKTISKKLSAVRSFAEYLNDNGVRVVLKADESIKIAKTLPKPIAHEHIVEALLSSELEERVVVTMLYTLGLRISELSSLEIQAVSKEWVRVIGKGNKQRDVPLLNSSKKLLDEYLSKYKRNKFVFEKNGEKLSENSLRYMVIKVFRRVGLKVSPHQLRHSFASQLLNAHAPIADVSELLGHSSMATTQIYTKLGSALKQQNYSMAHPLCGIKES